MSFDKWRKRLEIAQLPTVAARRAALEKLKINHSMPDADDEGYYRKPITKKKLGADGKTNGQTEIIGWEPVAYFMDRSMLRGVIGDRDMAINEVRDEGLWSWVVSHPISEDWYRRVSERGEPWPDLVDPPNESVAAILDAIPAANRDVAKSDNQPPEEPAHVVHATGIDNAIAAALTKVTSEAEAALAAGSKNRLAELRLAADKAGKAIYEPLYRQYVIIQKEWSPMVTRAAAKEKLLNTAILTFRESERKRIAAEQLAATIENERIAALNERVADRAIEAGATEAPEFIAEVALPLAPAPVSATYRAPGQRSTVKEIETWHLDEITSYDLIYQHFKNNPVLQQTLKTIATAAVKLGQTVPGTKTHKGLV